MTPRKYFDVKVSLSVTVDVVREYSESNQRWIEYTRSVKARGETEDDQGTPGTEFELSKISKRFGGRAKWTGKRTFVVTGPVTIDGKSAQER